MSNLKNLSYNGVMDQEFEFLAVNNGRIKKVVVLGGAHHKSRKGSCGQITTFVGDFFFA